MYVIIYLLKYSLPIAILEHLIGVELSFLRQATFSIFTPRVPFTFCNSRGKFTYNMLEKEYKSSPRS